MDFQGNAKETFQRPFAVEMDWQKWTVHTVLPSSSHSTSLDFSLGTREEEEDCLEPRDASGPNSVLRKREREREFIERKRCEVTDIFTLHGRYSKLQKKKYPCRVAIISYLKKKRIKIRRITLYR